MDRKILYKRGVNAVTATGGAISASSIYFAFEGHAQAAWVLMGLGIVIDALDGTLVRLLDLGETLPRYDGDRLDEYADLITFVLAPVGFAWAEGLLPFDWTGIGTGMVVVAVSTLQFAREDNKTEHAFWGWPSFWNIAYLYAWGADIPPVWVIALSLVLSAGVFVPVPFAYPSRLPKLRKTTTALGVLWGGVLFAYVVAPELDETLLYLSLAYPLYYFSLSAILYEDLK